MEDWPSGVGATVLTGPRSSFWTLVLLGDTRARPRPIFVRGRGKGGRDNAGDDKRPSSETLAMGCRSLPLPPFPFPLSLPNPIPSALLPPTPPRLPEPARPGEWEAQPPRRVALGWRGGGRAAGALLAENENEAPVRSLRPTWPWAFLRLWLLERLGAEPGPPSSPHRPNSGGCPPTPPPPLTLGGHPGCS